MDKKNPVRTCIGCYEAKDKKELLRLVKQPEGMIAVDVSGRMNGRGAYLCRNNDCLVKAVKKRGLERSFKMAISDEVVKSLYEQFSKAIAE